MTRDAEKIRAAFDGLHASQNTYEEVMMRIEQTDGARSGRMGRAKLAAAVTVGALACATTAWALSSAGFFDAAFGPKGQPDVEVSVHENISGSTFQLPAMSWADVNPDEARRLVGDAVENVGATVEAGGYTLTVEDCVVDDLGRGVATYSLARADGGNVLDDVYDVGYGQFASNPDATFRDVQVYGLGGGTGDEGRDGFAGGRYDCRSVMDLTSTTEEELHAVMYFGPFDGAGEAGIVWRLVCDDATDSQGTETLEALTDPFLPARTLASTTLASEDGRTVHVSPLGITFDGPFGEFDEQDPWVVNHVVLHLADGGEYVVKDGDVQMNFTTGWACDDGSLWYCFNQLVDPEQVVSVETDAPDGGSILFAAA